MGNCRTDPFKDYKLESTEEHPALGSLQIYRSLQSPNLFASPREKLSQLQSRNYQAFTRGRFDKSRFIEPLTLNSVANCSSQTTERLIFPYDFPSLNKILLKQKIPVKDLQSLYISVLTAARLAAREEIPLSLDSHDVYRSSHGQWKVSPVSYILGKNKQAQIYENPWFESVFSTRQNYQASMMALQAAKPINVALIRDRKKEPVGLAVIKQLIKEVDYQNRQKSQFLTGLIKLPLLKPSVVSRSPLPYVPKQQVIVQSRPAQRIQFTTEQQPKLKDSAPYFQKIPSSFKKPPKILSDKTVMSFRNKNNDPQRNIQSPQNHRQQPIQDQQQPDFAFRQMKLSPAEAFQYRNMLNEQEEGYQASKKQKGMSPSERVNFFQIPVVKSSVIKPKNQSQKIFYQKERASELYENQQSARMSMQQQFKNSLISGLSRMNEKAFKRLPLQEGQQDNSVRFNQSIFKTSIDYLNQRN